MPSFKAFTGETLRVILPLIILACGVGGFIAIGKRDPLAEEPKEKKIPLVRTEPAAFYKGNLQIEVDGLVVPYREVQLAAEVGGRVIYKNPECQAGDYVKRGNPFLLAASSVGFAHSPLAAIPSFPPNHPFEATLLVQIDSRDYELEVERLTKEMNQAEAGLNELEIDLENTKDLIELAQEQVVLQRKELFRAQRLVAQRAGSYSALEETQQKELNARNNLQKVKNDLRSHKKRRDRLSFALDLVKARLKKARLDLERTYIYAPFNGVVVSNQVEQDTYVKSGTTLVTVEDTSAVEVICNLRREELAWVMEQGELSSEGIIDPTHRYQLPKTPVKVVYELEGNQYYWEGFLDRFDGIGVDEKTRTFPCRILVPDPGNTCCDQVNSKRGPRALVRGMYVTVMISVRPSSVLLEIPESAVRPGSVSGDTSATKVVWKVGKKQSGEKGIGVLKIVPVQIARIQDGKALIKANAEHLKAKDRVIVSSHPFVYGGIDVKEEAR